MSEQSHPRADEIDMLSTRELLELMHDEDRHAIEAVASGQSDEIELAPQNAYVRRLQHELAERASLSSRSTGHDPVRRVQIYR